MTDAEAISAANPPYLTLTISQALSLPAPPSPEPAQHESVNAMLDARAAHMPDTLAAGFTYLDRERSSWACHTLTYSQVRTLSLNAAAELAKRLPEKSRNTKSSNGTALVAVLSPSGLELFGHIVGLWRLGYGVLCIAPGSPAESIANLLRLTQTETILAHQAQLDAAQEAVKSIVSSSEDTLRPQVCGMLTRCLDLVDSPTDKQGEDKAKGEDVLVTMHTSGSSGLPKPIYQLHRFWTTSLLSAPGRNLAAFTTTPLYHGGMSDLLRSIQAGSSIFFHPTADPGTLSIAAICHSIHACPRKTEYFLSVPYILDLLFGDKSDKGREMLRGMAMVSTGGAPLPQALGDRMVEHGVRLVSRLGSSECGFLMSSWRDFEKDNEWNALRIPDELGQKMLRFEPMGELYELVVTNDWPTKLVSNRDDGSYATSDLYAKVEGTENTWRYDSRSDDTLVLVSGKKASAPVAEGKLKASSLVSEAIVFGANRAILGALVFVSPEAAPEGKAFDFQAKISILEQLQPILSDINARSAPHAQLATEMVHLLPPSELASIPRASKGTLQRGRAYTHFAGLIDSVYKDFEEGRSLSGSSSSGGSKMALGGDKLVSWLQGSVESINGHNLEPDKDVFVAGVDSIQSARIRAAIHQHIDLGGQLLERNVVYQYPTLRQLSQHIEAVRSGTGDDCGRAEKELQLMIELVEKYSRPTKATPLRTDDKLQNGKGTLYVLTGVTGGLGAQILNAILTSASPHDSVVCLVRASSQPQHGNQAKDRVLASLESRCLYSAHSQVKMEGSQVVCCACNISEPDCGQRAKAVSLAALRHGRVVTIHAAWSVNFVVGLSSFESKNIAGLAHLIDLHRDLVQRCEDPSKSHFLFCSSVASVLGKSGQESVEERLSTDPTDAVPMGYARSKWVAEQIVSQRASASVSSKGNMGVVRIGQLTADTENGVWNESEAWPILIRLSQQMGAFPDLPHESLHWLSTDVAARTILDLTRHIPCHTGEAGIYNLAQPSTTTTAAADPPVAAQWSDLYSWLKASGLDLSLVPPREWLDKVKEDEACDHRGLLGLWEKNFTSTPAIAVPTRFVCETALQVSPGFRDWQNQGVTQSLIQKTVRRWKEFGFLT